MEHANMPRARDWGASISCEILQGIAKHTGTESWATLRCVCQNWSRGIGLAVKTVRLTIPDGNTVLAAQQNATQLAPPALGTHLPVRKTAAVGRANGRVANAVTTAVYDSQVPATAAAAVMKEELAPCPSHSHLAVRQKREQRPSHRSPRRRRRHKQQQQRKQRQELFPKQSYLQPATNADGHGYDVSSEPPHRRTFGTSQAGLVEGSEAKRPLTNIAEAAAAAATAPAAAAAATKAAAAAAAAAPAQEPCLDASTAGRNPQLQQPSLEHLAWVYKLQRHAVFEAAAAAADAAAAVDTPAPAGAADTAAAANTDKAAATGRATLPATASEADIAQAHAIPAASDSHAAGGVASSVGSSRMLAWGFLEAADRLGAAFPAYENLTLGFSEPLPLAALAGAGAAGVAGAADGVVGGACGGRLLQHEVLSALRQLLSERLQSLTLSGYTPYPLLMTSPAQPPPPPLPISALPTQQQGKQQCPTPQHYAGAARAASERCGRPPAWVPLSEEEAPYTVADAMKAVEAEARRGLSGEERPGPRKPPSSPAPAAAATAGTNSGIDNNGNSNSSQANRGSSQRSDPPFRQSSESSHLDAFPLPAEDNRDSSPVVVENSSNNGASAGDDAYLQQDRGATLAHGGGGGDSMDVDVCDAATVIPVVGACHEVHETSDPHSLPGVNDSDDRPVAKGRTSSGGPEAERRHASTASAAAAPASVSPPPSSCFPHPPPLPHSPAVGPAVAAAAASAVPPAPPTSAPAPAPFPPPPLPPSQPLLCGLTQLVSLTLSCDRGFPAPQHLAALAALPRLQQLDMRGAKFMQQEDPSACLLARHTWQRLGGEHLACLARCTALTQLRLNQVHSVAGQQLAALSCLTALTGLGLTDALSGQLVQGGHLRDLAAGLPRLRWLELGRVTCPPLHLLHAPPFPKPQPPQPQPLQPLHPPPAEPVQPATEGEAAAMPHEAATPTPAATGATPACVPIGTSTATAGAAAAAPSESAQSLEWGPALSFFHSLTSLHLQVACCFELPLLYGIASLPYLRRLSLELLDLPPQHLTEFLMELLAMTATDAGAGPEAAAAAAAAAGTECRGGGATNNNDPTAQPNNSPRRPLSADAKPTAAVLLPAPRHPRHPHGDSTQPTTDEYDDDVDEALQDDHGKALASHAGVAQADTLGRGRTLRNLLHSLSLTACMLFEEHLSLVGQLHGLRSLSLDQVELRTRDPEGGWSSLAGLRRLRSFAFRAWSDPLLLLSATSLCGSVLTSDGLQMMAANWPELRQLSYSGKVVLTEKAEEHLQYMPHLQTADITGTDGTTCRAWRNKDSGRLLTSLSWPYEAAAAVRQHGKVSSRNGYVTYSDSSELANSEGSEASVNWMGEVGYVTSEYDAD
ncbi:hypothetical protein Agub_g6460 [Astrephomene gubernaculifera]|uniref:F-box domain-containing protein n=1 Tax=Astrephomene gubernaculifera TaxID=47775 RepID=A0AAD3DPY9_9CHLO|nr:hypothetical protein Agub_g6460 [Astrephomene gubernaculifera]